MLRTHTRSMENAKHTLRYQFSYRFSLVFFSRARADVANMRLVPFSAPESMPEWSKSGWTESCAAFLLVGTELSPAMKR